MSSRNGYLSAAERQIAPRLQQTLQAAASALQRGEAVAAVESRSTADLAAAGFEPDYFSVRRTVDLEVPDSGDRELVILAAARLGRARLIDNLRVDL
jgi:pantoate--beta-alanine ligase